MKLARTCFFGSICMSVYVAKRAGLRVISCSCCIQKCILRQVAKNLRMTHRCKCSNPIVQGEGFWQPGLVKVSLPTTRAGPFQPKPFSDPAIQLLLGIKHCAL